ncbi:MAG: hypothetical protein GY844_12110 [Bradyrhizobium sp.]|jgi:hypothetical protein|uniref:hypothetical protein n=1 Tax=unclassified Sphingomonas TaxID=196159 RepID=UPI000B2E4D9D|nr:MULTISPECIES: hypothetical protein [unclassified Sphingomonas]MCP4617162.1 hypothetical protein [Bradyrhizobium sp.]
MNVISSTSRRTDPHARMDARIAAAAPARATGSGDRNLASDRAADGKPGDMRERIDGLVDQQVKSGLLTDDQAAELRRFFAEGPGGKEAPPASRDGDLADSADGTATTRISDAAARQLDAMAAFLQKLRDAATSSSVYRGNAETSGNGGAATGRVIDRQA